MQQLRAPIIAVFGSSDKHKPDPVIARIARTLGERISQDGQIVLTGGTGKPDTTIKECALQGALENGGRGIGVLQKGGPGHAINGQLFIVTTNLGHRRNYLEACLCDAAIALPGSVGSAGTVSEALFCLALGKPVVFIGDYWKQYGIGTATCINLPLMIAHATGRVGEDLTAVDTTWDAVSDGLCQGLVFRYLDDPQAVMSDAQTALGWLTQHIGDERPGRFPTMDNGLIAEQYAGVNVAFEPWVQSDRPEEQGRHPDPHPLDRQL